MDIEADIFALATYREYLDEYIDDLGESLASWRFINLINSI